MIQDITRNIDIVEQSINWANKYCKDTFPKNAFKNYRRELKKIKEALAENCSAAAYGQSQVGKSYLMSSLLSTPESPFVITNDGKKYSFIDEINASGGENTQSESTGVITRFTIRQNNELMSNFVKLTNLSVVDIILLLVDSYYNDVQISADTTFSKEDIDKKLQELSELWIDKSKQYNVITEDDIKDICDYLKDIIGNNAVNICHSKFCDVVGSVINYISPDEWFKVFGLLWNENIELNKLFNTIINEYKKIQFKINVYVPFDAVLRKNGTLLKVDWLDLVCGVDKGNTKDILYTDVYDENGKLIAKDFSKACLSALIGELTFVLPKEIANERKFLKSIDLLDFPGARSRERFREEQLKEVLPTILRRGKVAYLFNKYSRSLKISSVLFCHHNDQKTEATIGNSINNWVEENIGETPEIRANVIEKTKSISPLFFVCTKFNKDLEKLKIETASTRIKDDHWKRFDRTIPEIIGPEDWFEKWVVKGGVFSSSNFQNIYLLRDFYWSSKNQVFDGYNEEKGTIETEFHKFDEYPNYFEDLRKSFLENNFVKKHFYNPEQTWNDVATINNDGSKAIIRNLDAISEDLDQARKERYKTKLLSIKNEILNKLSVYYESEDLEEKNKKVRQIVGDLKLKTEFAFGEKPELFGCIIDSLMISSVEIRTLAYDILVRYIEEPKTVSAIKMIRALAKIDTKDDRNTNITKLCERYSKQESELKNYFHEQGIDLEDIISDKSELLATIPDVITKHITECWVNHLNKQVKNIKDFLPYSDEIVYMIISLFNKLEIKKIISDTINNYYTLFDNNSLPNVIGDYASLTFNNFVSTIGREYISNTDIENIAKKAEKCNLKIDISSSLINPSSEQQSLLDVLSALDQSGNEINNTLIDLSVLKRLPFWNSFQRWENFITIGLLYINDISSVDPIANSELKTIMDINTNLYK